jgi:hypothetical protein
MASELVIRLSPAAEAAVLELMRRYGEPTPSAMVSRALGFLQAVEPYVDDGVLTIDKPGASGDDDGLVEFEFENVPRHENVHA